jgi:hypothetical protein
LGPIERVLRYAHFAHGVVLGSHGIGHTAIVLRGPGPE